MASDAGMTVVNARVSGTSLERARGVLAAAGLTVSQAIRDLVDQIAESGEVPRFVGRRPHDGELNLAALTARAEELTRRELHEADAWGSVERDDDLLSQERVSRFG